MIGGLIAAGVGLASSIFGGIKAANAAKKVKADLAQQRSENKAWRDRHYYEDATQRADALRAMERAKEFYKQRNKASQGAAAVMGASAELAAADKASANKASANKAIGDAMASIAVAGEARKDKIDEQARNRDANIRANINAAEGAKAQAIGQAVSGTGQAVAQGVGAFMSNKAGGTSSETSAVSGSTGAGAGASSTPATYSDTDYAAAYTPLMDKWIPDQHIEEKPL